MTSSDSQNKSKYIALGVDHYYAQLAGVLINSVVRNGEVPDASLIVCDYNLSDQDRQNIQACAEGRPVRFVVMDEEAKERINKFPRTVGWSRAMYSRLLLPDLLEGSGLLLYLDCDMVVRKSLQPLFDTDLGENMAAAVRDAGLPHDIAGRNRRLGRPEDTPYFNSGMFLVDLGQWRQHRVGERCLEILETRPPRYPDQEALNLVLEGKWVEVDRTWNFTEFKNAKFPRSHYDDAAILHYTGRKPHLAHCEHPARDVYLAQRAFTPWKDTPLISNTRRRLRREWRKFEIFVDKKVKALAALLGLRGNGRPTHS